MTWQRALEVKLFVCPRKTEKRQTDISEMLSRFTALIQIEIHPSVSIVRRSLMGVLLAFKSRSIRGWLWSNLTEQQEGHPLPKESKSFGVVVTRHRICNLMRDLTYAIRTYYTYDDDIRPFRHYSLSSTPGVGISRHETRPSVVCDVGSYPVTATFVLISTPKRSVSQDGG